MNSFEKINKTSLVQYSKSIFWTILLCSSLAVAIEHTNGPAERTGKKIDTATKNAGEYIDDSAITAKIKSEILQDPLTKHFGINVTTTKGVVDLTGIVESQQTIDRAIEIARRTKYVSSVKNNLFIKNVK